MRSACAADRQRISDLMFLESHVHQHLDWRSPLDWLGHAPYWLLEHGDRIVSALACPVDPEPIAWIRLFAFSSQVSARDAWQRLWLPARRQLNEAGGATVAAIAAQPWFGPILSEDGFQHVDDIVLLTRESGAHCSVSVPPGVAIRVMSPADLPAVAVTDAHAFGPLWRNSLEALTRALAQACYASVAEDGSEVIGYQLSTGSAWGAHLARLAVLPAAQRRGVGAALVGDLLTHLQAGSQSRLTVNTQAQNAGSLALYRQFGFRLTGERYPVYTAQAQERASHS